MQNMKRKQFSVYQLKITLKYSKPPIWRRLLVPSNVSLGELGRIIRIAFDWGSSHLYEFTIKNEFYGPRRRDGFEIGFTRKVNDEDKVRLGDIIPRRRMKFLYTYDFGDNWEHEILVEKISSPELGQYYPVCIKGKRASPIEDSGGMWGHKGKLAIMNDPKHPEYKEVMEWLGGRIDPERFDLDKINSQLRESK